MTRKSLLTVLIYTLAFVAPLTVQAEPAAPPQAAVVHLTHATDDLHAAFMALKLAGAMQEKGARVTLLLDLEGVRVADTRQPGDLVWGHGEPLATYYDSFVKGGGKVLVCPHCAAAAGMDAKVLRPGAQIAKDVAELAALLLAADKILDY
jgi:predicted peroxiredoxin